MLCLALTLGLLATHLPRRGGWSTGFVAGPVPRPRVTTNAAAAAADDQSSSDEDALRARVAALELKLKLTDRVQQKDLQVEVEKEEELAQSPLQLLIDKIIVEVPQIQEVENARLGMDEDNMFILNAGNSSKRNPIYKRKYEVMGMVLTQQESFMKAKKRALRSAKDSVSFKELLELESNGGQGMTRKQVKAQLDRIAKSDPINDIVVKTLLPSLKENPLMDGLATIGVTVVIIVIIGALLLCIAGPVATEVEE